MTEEEYAEITISIHSPRMGRDTKATINYLLSTFQSTLPAWGETDKRCKELV